MLVKCAESDKIFGNDVIHNIYAIFRPNIG